MENDMSKKTFYVRLDKDFAVPAKDWGEAAGKAYVLLCKEFAGHENLMRRNPITQQEYEGNHAFPPDIHPDLSKADLKAIRTAPEGTIFSYTWRNKFIATHAKTLNEFRIALADGAALLARWEKLGITLQEGGAEDDYATFITDSKEIALAVGFLPEPLDEDE